MHHKNSFITLTYSDEHLKSPKLNYEDFQKFMKRLRRSQNDPIGVFVTGEYGEKTKRPHWHAILFGYRPTDETYKYSNDRGDKAYTSCALSRIWGQGEAEFGSVTLHSASYCARYAAKKLVHGQDQEHEFHPISKKSSKHAIGKKWLETHWRDVFTHGYVVHEGQTLPVPRYYERWLKQNHFSQWLHYVTETKKTKIDIAQIRSQKEQYAYELNIWERNQSHIRANPLKRSEVRKRLTEARLKILQEKLKL